MYAEERREVQEIPLTFPRLSQKGYNSMALLIPHTSSNVRSTPVSRTSVVVTAYVVLAWFLLVLSGSVLGLFAQSPLVFYLTAGGPVVLFLAGYVLSEVFRGFVRSLVGDPWGITAFQVYRGPSRGNLSANTAIHGTICMVCCPSKQRKQRSGDAECQEAGQWTISHSNDSAPTAGNRWRLGPPSVPSAACRRAHHPRAGQARFRLERSQAIRRPMRRRQYKRKMIHSRLSWPLAT